MPTQSHLDLINIKDVHGILPKFSSIEYLLLLHHSTNFMITFFLIYFISTENYLIKKINPHNSFKFTYCYSEEFVTLVIF